MINRMGSSYESSTRALLESALGAAVPLWIEQLKERPWAAVQARVDSCLTRLTEHGDEVLYRSHRPGGTAEAFNRLAEAIAILSFMPGGVTSFGGHWESKHPDMQ